MQNYDKVVATCRTFCLLGINVYMVNDKTKSTCFELNVRLVLVPTDEHKFKKI